VHDTVSFYLGGARVLIFGGSQSVKNLAGIQSLKDKAEKIQENKLNSYNIYDLTVDCLVENSYSFPSGKTYFPFSFDF
jgi:hypothetical protein